MPKFNILNTIYMIISHTAFFIVLGYFSSNFLLDFYLEIIKIPEVPTGLGRFFLILYILSIFFYAPYIIAILIKIPLDHSFSNKEKFKEHKESPIIRFKQYLLLKFIYKDKIIKPSICYDKFAKTYYFIILPSLFLLLIYFLYFTNNPVPHDYRFSILVCGVFVLSILNLLFFWIEPYFYKEKIFNKETGETSYITCSNFKIIYNENNELHSEDDYAFQLLNTPTIEENTHRMYSHNKLIK